MYRHRRQHGLPVTPLGDRRPDSRHTSTWRRGLDVYCVPILGMARKHHCLHMPSGSSTLQATRAMSTGDIDFYCLSSTSPRTHHSQCNFVIIALVHQLRAQPCSYFYILIEALDIHKVQGGPALYPHGCVAWMHHCLHALLVNGAPFCSSRSASVRALQRWETLQGCVYAGTCYRHDGPCSGCARAPGSYSPCSTPGAGGEYLGKALLW